MTTTGRRVRHEIAGAVAVSALSCGLSILSVVVLALAGHLVGL